MKLSEFKDRLDSILLEFKNLLPNISCIRDIELNILHIVSRKGELAVLSKEIGKIHDCNDKLEAGKLFNKIRNEIFDTLEDLKLQFNEKKKVTDLLDITIPGRKFCIGSKHPISLVIEDCVNIFRRMGFITKNGPDVDTIENCFDLLNVPLTHPSRDETDTFYLYDKKHVLRTHTSNVQIKVMKDNSRDNIVAPIKIISPGVCFRSDTVDATHNFNFHQLEGLYIDHNVSMSDLKSVLLHFARELLGKDTDIRLRPHFFPFTEPSVEYDFKCFKCKGVGCSMCKNSGWIEISGAGIVNPIVLDNLNYSPDVYSGFAFGMGIERIAMLRYEIDDIRLLYENDVRFLNNIVNN